MLLIKRSLLEKEDFIFFLNCQLVRSNIYTNIVRYLVIQESIGYLIVTKRIMCDNLLELKRMNTNLFTVRNNNNKYFVNIHSLKNILILE